MSEKISSLNTHELLNEYLSGKELPEQVCEYGYNFNKHILASQITLDDKKFSEYEDIFVLIVPSILDEIIEDDFYKSPENDTIEYAGLYINNHIRKLFIANIIIGEDIIARYKSEELRVDTSGLSLSNVLDTLDIFSETYEQDIHAYLKKYTNEGLKELEPKEIPGNTGSLIKTFQAILMRTVSR